MVARLVNSVFSDKVALEAAKGIADNHEKDTDPNYRNRCNVLENSDHRMRCLDRYRKDRRCDVFNNTMGRAVGVLGGPDWLVQNGVMIEIRNGRGRRIKAKKNGFWRIIHTSGADGRVEV